MARDLPALAPVDIDGPLPLRDRDAGPPEGIPGKERLEEETERLLERLAKLQRVFHADARRALLVVLQGRDASGKDGTIRRVCGAFNPQGCTVTSFKAPSPLEASHDFLWRIHAAAPARGMIGIFNRSHYEDVLVARVRSLVPKPTWRARFDRIVEFERGLTAEGTVVRKFFLHVSRDEQRKRLLERIENENKNWKFDAGDLEDRARWGDYTRAYRDVLRRCSTPEAPWYVVPADDKHARDYLIARALVETLESLDLRYPPPDKAIKKYAALLDD